MTFFIIYLLLFFFFQGPSVLTCLTSVLHDDKELPQTEKSDPDHFLNEKRNNIKKSDYFMAFSVGKQTFVSMGVGAQVR